VSETALKAVQKVIIDTMTHLEMMYTKRTWVLTTYRNNDNC